ncbi:MAG TPA: DUF72 domain-containing protein [Gemmataceae bacterium]
MNVWIGTCGYSYADWVGDFYPPGTRSDKMLPYYCRVFPLVELNFTFYRVPTASMLARLAGKTPHEFQFIVKLPRSLSHSQRADDLAAFRDAVAELQGRKQLLGLLCQLPPSTHYGKKTLQWLQVLSIELSEMRLAVEFRHRSWWRADLPAWMTEHHLDLVSVDVPDVPALFPRGWVHSGRRAYVRLHSRNAKSWYGGETKRYDYKYSDGELNEWIEKVNAEKKRLSEVLFLFNNCYRVQAIANAQRLRELIEERTAVSVVPPFAESAPKQRTLFDS